MTAPTRPVTALGAARAAAGAGAGAPAALARGVGPSLARRVAGRLGTVWLPGAAWTIGRTGRTGLAGLALLLGAALFLFSTHRQVAAEVQALRTDLAEAQSAARAPAPEVSAAPAPGALVLPARADMPAILRGLFEQAARARLSLDTAKYEVDAVSRGGVARYQIAFPVRGSYPQIRAFLDETLASMPAVALGDLVLERKSIGDASVEAQLRMYVYTRSIP